jgi:histidinol-phosphate aminotransferase
MSIENLVKRARKAVQDMKPYVSARSLVNAQDGMVLLDANECPYEPYISAQPLARYADQQPKEMMDAICRLYDVSSRNIMAARGADECIEIIIRAFCEAGKDNIIITPPTFPMYAHSAKLQGADVKEVPLLADTFDIDKKNILKAIDKNTKAIFLCSPNNPTGNIIAQEDIIDICKAAEDKALVVLDEIYIEYADVASCIPLISKYPNLVILRSLSKAYASAGLRCGFAIAQDEIIQLLRKVLAIYPTPQPVAREVIKILSPKNVGRLKENIQAIKVLKKWVENELQKIDGVEKVFETHGNFCFVKFKDADAICKTALENGYVLRDQSYQKNMDNCVRFSMGTREEMEALLKIFKGEKVGPITKTARTAQVRRATNETSIDVKINLDKTSPVTIHTGIGFYDHMLEQIGKHGGFSLQVDCEGDLHIDPHHTVEDCAIAIGQALKEALGDKRGIGRYGFTVPMDEAQATAVIDLSNRFFLKFDADFPDATVGELPTTLVPHVFRSIGENLGANIHISCEGEDTHHMVEGCFKAFARALRQAVAIEGQGDALPSTKGML